MAARIPTFLFSQLTLSENPPAPFLAPSDLVLNGPSPTPLNLPSAAQPLASTSLALAHPDRPLYLGIDSGVDRIKACVLDEELRVLWTAKVEIDEELHEYGTRDGVHTRGDSVTCPSIVRLHALDLLLTKLSRDCPDPTLLGRVVCISGAGQPNALHYLSPAFTQMLSAMPLTPHLSLSELFTPIPPSAPLFTVAEPTTDGDASTVEHIRALEAHFGQEQFDTSHPAGGAGVDPKRRIKDSLEKGREELVRRTGGRPCLRSPVAQLMKVLEENKTRVEEEAEFVRDPKKARKGLLETTERIVLESGLLASVFLGRLAPMDDSDACTTGMFNPILGDWDDDILAFVAGEEDEEGAEKLEGVLGEVGGDGGKPLGTISAYFVNRFGFSPTCLISPFTGSEIATALAYPLSSSQGDVLISLCGVAETDSLIAPVAGSRYATSQDWNVVRSPVRADELDAWYYMTSAGYLSGALTHAPRVPPHGNRDAGIGRALLRDLYCNGKWNTFEHLSGISPHGGTLGIDEKYFAYFFPHREASLAQGFLRFVAGARTPEFSDRKINPRLLVESQVMTLRIGLGRLLRAMQTPAQKARDGIRPFDAVGFSALSPSTTAERLVLVGEAAQNKALASILASVFDAPAFLPASLAGDTESTTDPTALLLAATKKTSPAALGTAYKAAWTYHRSTTDERVSFQRFLRRAIETTAQADQQHRVASATEPTHISDPSQAGTFASSSAASGPPPSLLSLGGADLSHISTAGSSLPPAGFAAGAPQGYKHAHEEAGEVAHSAGDGLFADEAKVPGLKMVAVPDPDLHKYYASMLPEFARLKRCALKGLI
ncbi:hypothetical protein JCM10908_001454 [Rhodotorula pacifica]|uniref:xylulokinase n=1 Tax=Rhodotorula pacifica TaxID=1495444 RepID=UPI0031824408